jgi:thiol:disulfide interchange protein DsbD
MKSLARVLLLFVWLAPGLHAAAKTRASLLLSHASAKPGETITAALRLAHDPGWHTYWRNPGDAGSNTTIQWELPPGITAESIQWPVPEKMVIANLQDYVYEGETLLLIPLRIAANSKPGMVPLKGNADWLECSDKSCVPASGKVETNLTIGDSQPSPNAKLIDTWRERLPKIDPQLKLAGTWEKVDESTRNLIIEWKPNAAPDSPDFYPYENSSDVGAVTQVLDATAEKVRLSKTVKKPEEKPWPKQIHGIVVNGKAEQRKGFEVSFAVAPLPGDPTATANTGNSGQLGSSSAPGSFLAILGLAFLGGLILNIMPCVLPVIALKILGFVNQSLEAPKRVRELGLIYMLGVVASFLVLAGVILAVRGAAGDVNWGVQMQNPYFVVAMLVVVTLVTLNLWGVFEITLPGQALGAAGELASREGRSGAFYNGVLATLLATPCSAPFLGAAVGAVITRPAHIIIPTFAMIGLGLAFPYVLLSWNPRLLKFLPKPGRWMEKFKFAMGFPMAATVIWLWSFGSLHFGDEGGLWLGIFLLFIALGSWIYGDFAQRGTARRGLATVLALLVLAVGYGITLEWQLHWRQPRVVAESSDDELLNEPGGIQWRRWKPEAVAKARAEGHPVLIDFTAKWCVTCRVNKSTSIEVDPVKEKLKQMNAKAFLADYTLRDPKIGSGIRSYGRAAVPLVVVLPADPAAAPILLPEGLFTASTLLEALDLAAPKPGTQASK